MENVPMSHISNLSAPEAVKMASALVQKLKTAVHIREGQRGTYILFFADVEDAPCRKHRAQLVSADE